MGMLSGIEGERFHSWMTLVGKEERFRRFWDER